MRRIKEGIEDFIAARRDGGMSGRQAVSKWSSSSLSDQRRIDADLQGTGESPLEKAKTEAQHGDTLFAANFLLAAQKRGLVSEQDTAVIMKQSLFEGAKKSFK